MWMDRTHGQFFHIWKMWQGNNELTGQCRFKAEVHIKILSIFFIFLELAWIEFIMMDNLFLFLGYFNEMYLIVSIISNAL